MVQGEEMPVLLQGYVLLSSHTDPSNGVKLPGLTEQTLQGSKGSTVSR